MSSSNILLGKSNQYKDHLSAYKLAVLVLIDEHIDCLDSMQDTAACHLMFTLLQLINVPDMEFKTLISKIRPILPPSAFNALMETLRELARVGLDGLFELMRLVPERLLCEPYNKVHSSHADYPIFTTSMDPFIHKNSVLGLFLRRLNLSFEMMSFHDVTKIYKNFQTYIQAYAHKDLKDATEKTDTTQQNTTQQKTTQQNTTQQNTTQQNTTQQNTTQQNTTQLTEDDLICTEEDESSSLNHEKSLLDSSKEGGVHSQRQSEVFIAQQANLLNNNECLALPPKELQLKINQLLITNSQLVETHFLQYMNYLRVREYNASICSLYNYFDRSYLSLSNLPRNQGNQSENNLHDDVNNHRFYRYAALNIATTHYRFGHRDQAILALREAIKIAHQTNDSVCLQYALYWLYRLGVFEKDEEESDGAYLLTKLIHSSHTFNLPNLMSLACLSNAKHAYAHSADPALVIESIGLSDLSSSSYLLVTSSSQKASLWNVYGNDELCMVNCLILLETTSSITPSLTSSTQPSSSLLQPSSSSPLLPSSFHAAPLPSSSSPPDLLTSCTNHCNSEEMDCLAFCHLCRLLSKEGKGEQAAELMAFTKKKYPRSSNQSNVWLFCEQQMIFYDSLLQGKTSQSDESIKNMASINGLESSYCRCVQLAESGENASSLKQLQVLLAACALNNFSASNVNHLITRCLILQSCLCIHNDDITDSLHPSLEAHKSAKRNHYRYLQAVTLCNMATLQLKTKKFKSAVDVIKQALPVIFENQNLLDQATALFIYVKCNLALVTKESGCSSYGGDGCDSCGYGSGGYGCGGCGRGWDRKDSSFDSSDEKSKNDDKVDVNKKDKKSVLKEHNSGNVKSNKDKNGDTIKMILEGVDEEGLGVAKEMAAVMGVVCEKYEGVKAYSRLKEALVFQSLLYHQLGMKGQRNKCASLHARLSCYLRCNNNDAVNKGTNSNTAINTSLLYLNVL